MSKQTKELRVTVRLEGEAVQAWDTWCEQYAALRPSNSQMVEALVLLSLVDGVAAKGGRVVRKAGG